MKILERLLVDDPNCFLLDLPPRKLGFWTSLNWRTRMGTFRFLSHWGLVHYPEAEELHWKNMLRHLSWPPREWAWRLSEQRRILDKREDGMVGRARETEYARGFEDGAQKLRDDLGKAFQEEYGTPLFPDPTSDNVERIPKNPEDPTP